MSSSDAKRYRFYITDTFDGCVLGTDSEEKAIEKSMVEEYFVVDSHTGETIIEGLRQPVEVLK